MNPQELEIVVKDHIGYMPILALDEYRELLVPFSHDLKQDIPVPGIQPVFMHIHDIPKMNQKLVWRKGLRWNCQAFCGNKTSFPDLNCFRCPTRRVMTGKLPDIIPVRTWDFLEIDFKPSKLKRKLIYLASKLFQVICNS